MSFDWLVWSNPIAIWWGFLVAVSALNVAVWLQLYRRLPPTTASGDVFRSPELLIVLLCAAYVFGCAFRSVLPRSDVQRICLFETWLSSVAVGRSVATVAELCFAAQWTIILHYLARVSKAGSTHNISNAIMPLIVLAELCSWYAVVTTSYLGNAIENSLWTVTYLLIAAALMRLLVEFHGVMRLLILSAILGIAGYVTFMLEMDVPMYFARWQADLRSGKQLLGLVQGIHDMSTHWRVTHDIAEWDGEIGWMSLYFSAAVWSSLALSYLTLMRHKLPRYRRQERSSGLAQTL